MNDSVISALEAALEADAENHEIRIHLASLLLDKGDHPSANQHYVQILAQDPANQTALSGAVKCARAMGDDKRAAGYTTLLSALGAGLGQSSGNSSADESGQDADRDEDQPIADSSANVTSIGNHQNQPTPVVRLAAVESSENVTIGPWDDNEPRISLADVGGMEDVKKRLDTAFLAPLRNPEVAKMYGKSLNGGLMLYGPPGCGKTFIARALAGELGAKFMSVGLSDVLDMWLGESERKLHEIFETARRAAPTVLFFDEIDALGQKRSQQRHSAGRNIVNQLLAELDSVDSDNKNLFVMSATNHPWDVDAALRRPGRFDRTVLVLPPDAPARASILEFHLRNKPLGQIDVSPIADATSHYSGADLAHLCESAVEIAMQASLASGDARPIENADLQQALADVKPSTRPWFESARNYAMFANEGGTYDDLLTYIKQNKL